jgi:hypothetical protein
MKKLTINDIPEGYNYAAVNGNGTAYAFKHKPFIGQSHWYSSSLHDEIFLRSEFDNAN